MKKIAIKPGSHNASPSSFGREFQTVAAIVLMLDTLKDNVSLNSEGEFEDAELTKNDGTVVYVQAKSKSEPYMPVLRKEKYAYNANAKSLLKKTFETFAEHVECFVARKQKYEFMYVSNLQYPFGEKGGRIWNGFLQYEQNGLTAGEKSVLLDCGYNEKMGNMQFAVIEMQPDPRYESSMKVPLERVRNFLYKLDIPVESCEEYLRNMTALCMHAESGVRFELKKIHFISHALVYRMRFEQSVFDNEFGNLGISSEIIEQRYNEIINRLSEGYECYSKIIAEFDKFGEGMSFIERRSRFIEFYYRSLIAERLSEVDEEYQECLAKYIILTVINKRTHMQKARKEFMDL